jgi:hypothetical protein
MPLSAKLSAVEIYAADPKVAEWLSQASEDIRGTMQVAKLSINLGKPKLAERVLAVKPNIAKLGPRLRKDTKAVVKTLRECDPKVLAKQLPKGYVTLTAAGKEFKIKPDEIKLIKETIVEGQKVEVLDILEPALTILITR